MDRTRAIITVAGLGLWSRRRRRVGAKSGRRTEVWKPEPPLVAPAQTPGGAPSDAVRLFDGGDLDQWVAAKDRSPAKWIVADGVLTVDKTQGNIETKQRIPRLPAASGMAHPGGHHGKRPGAGNSGVFLASTGPRDQGYEVQILDSYKNPTYVNGQAGSVYKQHPPLANASRPPGEWQTYDIVWRAPVFGADGALASPATRHAAAQRRPGAGQRGAGGRDGLYRQARLQGPRAVADQAAGARRSQRPDQFPQHLGARTGACATRGATRPAAEPCWTARRGGGAG